MGEYLGALAVVGNAADRDGDDAVRLMQRFMEAALAAERAGMNRSRGPSELIWLIFAPLPCFAETAARGGGMPSCISSFSTPNQFDEYNGRFEQMIATGQADVAIIAPITFNTVFPGYRPEAHLILAPEHTAMRVIETRANGSPVNNTSYYAWPGGHAFYEQRQDAMDALVDVISAPRDISFGRNLPGPGRRGQLAAPAAALGFDPALPELEP